MNNFLYNAYLNFFKIERMHQNVDLTKKNYQIIGIYDKAQKIWYNGWALYTDSNYHEYKSSRDLLIYALNIDKDMPLHHNMKRIIRYVLTNSKLYITEKKTQLYLILAIILYLINAKKWEYFKSGSDVFVFIADVSTYPSL